MIHSNFISLGLGLMAELKVARVIHKQQLIDNWNNAATLPRKKKKHIRKHIEWMFGILYVNNMGYLDEIDI